MLDGVGAGEAITGDPALSGVRVLVLTTFESDDSLVAALRAGASGFLAPSAGALVFLGWIATAVTGAAVALGRRDA